MRLVAFLIRRFVRRFVPTAALTVVALGVAHARAQDATGLGLASFDVVWQTIAESYYDPTFGGLDWRGVRDELRPRAASATTADATRDVIREMLGRIRQSHFVLLAPAAGIAPEGDATPRIDVRVVDESLVVTRVAPQSSAARAGLRLGDRIIAIDGRPADTLRPAGDASDRAGRLGWWRAAKDALRGRPDAAVRLDVRGPDGRDRQLQVAREVEAGELVTLGNIPPLRVTVTATEARTPRQARVGVLAFNVWLPAVSAPFADAIDRHRQASGLVIDLRGNPGGLAEMMRGIAGHLFDEPALLGRMKMRDLELEFRANPRRSTADGRRVVPYVGPVAILVDELTGSSSECFAGALQSLGRARVFGVTSMGQALPASTKQLPNGDALLYVVGDFITATGRRLEGSGVIPDELAPVTIDGLASGRDQALEAALRWIDTVALPSVTRADDR